ncbi:MAG: DUF6498-containing protein [Crocinitomicaceae bacterium]
MSEQKQKNMRRWLTIALVNLVPVIGVLFFDWEIFELALTYLLETAVIFLIFFIDRYFIDKRTRYPFIFACIQLFFLLFPFCGLVFAWVILTFSLTQPSFERSNLLFIALEEQFNAFNFFWVLLAMFLFKGLDYLLKNKSTRKHKSSALWYNLRRLLIIHLFVIVTGGIYGALPHNQVSGLFFIICLKIILDYLLENDRIMKRMDRALNKFATIGLNQDGSPRED